jgi:Zn-dependent protease with chaperone function
LLRPFEGRIPRAPVHVLYQLGLFLTALVMVLLPVCYVALAVLVGCGLYWYATNATAVFEGARGRNVLGALLIYLGPLVAGAILLFFMLKPFFAPRARRETPRRLERAKDKLLFAFVERLCAIVGAPMPRDIEVDTEVNAAASFRRGIWSFFSSDLVLTLGLPLLGGLNLRQLACVLAHEFGHFAQGVAMRLEYVVRSVNLWFARVVYERDGWDLALAKWSEQGVDWRIRIVFYLARGFVWVTRQVLRLLMLLGHGISCFMARQMEYDADQYSARVVGGQEIEPTLCRISELAAARHMAFSELDRAWRDGRLADDLTALVLLNAAKMPPEARQSFRESLSKERTGLFDTHPSVRDRGRAALAGGHKGIFQLEGPAVALLSDYPELCRAATEGFYREALGRKYKREMLVSAASVTEEHDLESAGAAALARLFRGQFNLLRPLRLPAQSGAPEADPDAGLKRANELRERLLAAAPAYAPACKQYHEADELMRNAHQASALLKAGLELAKPKEFGLVEGTLPAAVMAGQNARGTQELLAPGMTPFEEDVAQLLALGLDLLRRPEILAKVQDGQALRERAQRLRPAAVRLSALVPDIMEVRNEEQSLRQVLMNLRGKEVSGTSAAAVREQARSLEKTLQRLHDKLADLEYPFEHAKGPSTLQKLALPYVPDPDAMGELLEESGRAQQMVLEVYFRAMCHLSLAAEKSLVAAGWQTFD